MTKRNVHDQTPRRRWEATSLRIPIAVGVCAALAVAAAAPAVSGASVVHARDVSVASTDVLLEWNIIAQGEAILVRPTAHGQTRGMAMVQGAVYDAVNAIDRGHESYLLDVEALDIDAGASYDAAIATAAHHVLVSIVADARKPALDTQYAATMAGILDGASEGVRAGAAAAAAMITARMDDGFMDPFVFDIGTGAGDWRPENGVLDPDPWVGQLEPFLIQDPEQFRSNGPNRLTSTAYWKDFKEVKELGSLTSTTRTADQTTAAIFWQFAPAPLWNRLLRDLSVDHDVDTVDTARLLAMVNLAAADGAISCWNDKYYWSFWRPKAAIREADTDGNNKTVADPNWRSLFDPSTPTVPPLSTPPFPDHPSGHGCLSGAVLNTVRAFFGTDKIAFDMHSGRFPDQPRHFERFSQALEEIIDARVWGGIHFRTADEDGAAIGKKVAHWVDEHYFQPVE
jgi:hypothetical protein